MSLGPYRVGDNPASPIQVDVITDDDLDGYSAATVTVLGPTGLTVASIPAVLDEDLIEFSFPEGTFLTVGVHWVSIVLTGGDHTLTLDSLPLVVESVTSQWHTLDTARAEWAGAPVSDLVLFNLLEVAREDCIAYGPRLATDARVPVRYRAAQLMQARNTSNAMAASPGDGGGPDSFIIPAVAMTWKVMALLRPQKAVGAIG